ncbi:hypothetical protein BDV97DRAFT_92526 [Delphinella strobiligena]|nr:hypothetical protein BDV97DRAFT_92526 [Delphinella strobiligena]
MIRQCFESFCLIVGVLTSYRITIAAQVRTISETKLVRPGGNELHLTKYFPRLLQCAGRSFTCLCWALLVGTYPGPPLLGSAKLTIPISTRLRER